MYFSKSHKLTIITSYFEVKLIKNYLNRRFSALLLADSVVDMYTLKYQEERGTLSSVEMLIKKNIEINQFHHLESYTDLKRTFSAENCYKNNEHFSDYMYIHT